NDKKLKYYTKEELDTLLYTKPTKLKNPPENWPKTAKFEGLIHRFRRSFLLNDNFEKNKFKNDIERVVTSQKCQTCDGKRLNQNVLKSKINEELDTLLYTKPTKLKNPPENWPKTAKFEGLIHRFRRSFLLNDNFEKNKFKNDIERVVTSQKCPTCDGKRLNQNVLKSKINGLDIADFTHSSIDDAMHFIKKLESSKAQFIINPLLKQLESLSYIGLNYLTLDRETKTLSGGESQRIKLIRHLNSPLSDLVYIIDEPSVGLHPEDIQKIN